MDEMKRAEAVDSSVGAEEQHPQTVSLKTTIPLNDDYIKQIFKENDSIVEKELAELKKKSCSPAFLETCSAAELMEKFFENKPYIIDTLLDPGVYLLVGAPKLGKSFLSLQVGYHVSTGTVLWDCRVRKGTVLYFALEDTEMRLQKRLYQMVYEQGNEQKECQLHFATKSHGANDGLFDQLSSFTKEHPDTSLVIIDTLQKVRDSEAETYSYSNDYALISRFMEFSKANNIAIILVHHTRKQFDNDPFNMVSGTNGLTGAVDGTMILSKAKRTDDCAVLEITGRDLQDQKLHLKRNEKTLAWDLEKRETELWKEPEDPVLDKVAAFMTDRTNWVGSATDLCKDLNLEMEPNALSRKLNANVQRLYKDYGICYLNKRTNKGSKIIITPETEVGE